MAILLPVPASSFSDEGQRQQRAGLAQARSKLFFDSAQTLFGMFGLDTAAKNLRRYRSGIGGTQTYSDEEIAEHDLITEAEDRNRTRFISQTLTARTGKEDLNDHLLTLKDGDEYRIQDHWKSSAKLNGVIEKLLHPDTFEAFGQFDVRSTSDLKARRKGNRLYVTGTVRHGFDEETEQEKNKRQAKGDYSKKEENMYDFNEGATGSGAARDLEPIGAAKPFRMQYDRVQDLEAEVEYMPDGRLLVRSAKWGAIR
jgi:hypothetical protein